MVQQHNIDTRPYGYAHPPHGLIDDILPVINFNQPVVLYLHDPLSGLGMLPYEEITQEPKHNLFVVLQTGEGHSYHEFRQMIAILINQCNVNPQHIVIYSGCLSDPYSPVSLIGTIVPTVTNTLDAIKENRTVLTSDPTHHYVCLNRDARWERWDLVEHLLDRGLERFGKISYMSRYSQQELKLLHDSTGNKLSFITAKYQHLFPMCIDSEPVDFYKGFDVSNPAITNALFNIVTESSYEKPKSKGTHEIGQRSPGLTEKTFKAIILGQVPVMVAPKGTVNIMRDLGFDTFDDIIDNQFDLEDDPILRVKMVADQVEKICTLPMDVVAALKKQLHMRFVKNLERLHYFNCNNQHDISSWSKYFTKVGMVT